MNDPRLIDIDEWQRKFLDLDPEQTKAFRYFRHLGDRVWNRYLKPPSAFLPYGLRRLKRLHYDEDLRSLRLWAFVLEESERIFRGKRAGMRAVALMGDYGAVAPLVYAFPDVVAFYPDFTYWTPFLTESDVLLDRAEARGLSEDTCFVRAAVGAFSSRSYWPDPDLVIASSGASCDDLSAVTEYARLAGHPVRYLEIPRRKCPADWLHVTRFETDAGLPPGTPPRQDGLLGDLTASYRRLLTDLETTFESTVTPEQLAASVDRARTIRKKIGRIREAVATAPRAPLPACEALLVEFAATHFYGDPVECETVIDGILALVTERVREGIGFGTDDDVRIVWGTPPPDPLLHVQLEKSGGRVAGTEYLIASALTPLPDGDPVEAVARSFLAGSLLGSSVVRADYLVREVKLANAEGVILSNIFGSSHCGAETPVIRKAVEERCGLPVLAFDVPKPAAAGISSQVVNRMEAFLEALRQRRNRR